MLSTNAAQLYNQITGNTVRTITTAGPDNQRNLSVIWKLLRDWKMRSHEVPPIEEAQRGWDLRRRAEYIKSATKTNWNDCSSPSPLGIYVKDEILFESRPQRSITLWASRSRQCLGLPGEVKYTQLYTFLILFSSVSSKALDSPTA